MICGKNGTTKANVPESIDSGGHFIVTFLVASKIATPQLRKQLRELGCYPNTLQNNLQWTTMMPQRGKWNGHTRVMPGTNLTDMREIPRPPIAQTNKITSPHTKCTHEHIFFVLSLSAPNKIGSREGEGELKMFTP